MKLPNEVKNIIEQLEKAGFQGYAVGGCVRDLMLGKKPKDWDVTTDASPEEIQKVFPDNFYKNKFGTVTAKTGSEDVSLKEIEITPFRVESEYKDKRHPEEVRFVKKLDEDLSRRDFTVNAMAMDKDGKVIDLFGGESDLDNKLIRTVGEPAKRFGEDALRMLRAIRFTATLGFEIEKQTLSELKNNSEWLAAVSKERLREEFVKIILSDNAYGGVLLLEESGLLKHVVPELREGIGIEQNLHHIYTVWEHLLRALKYSVEKNYSLEVRLASLFHDIGKPRSKRGEGRDSTFYGHEVIGAKMTAQIMERLKFSREQAENIIKLVRYHMFYYNPEEVTESSVRRLLVRIGKENVEDLLKVREADRIGSGRPKAVPYKLRHLKYIIDKVSDDPISAKMLKIDGKDVMKELGIEPSPKVGLILNSLLAEVVENPSKNVRENLMQRIHDLDKKSPEELRESLKKIDDAIEREEEERRKKYYV